MARVYDHMPRHSFYWLLTAVVLAVLPHLLHAPWWLRALAIALVLYRWSLHLGRGKMPSKLARTALLLAFTAGVWQQHGTLFGVEPSTQLLVGAFLLKTLEMFRRRDAYVLLVLGYFVTATLLLFYQGPFAALYALLALWAFTAAFIGVNVPVQDEKAWQHGRTSASIMLQSIPMMLLLFVLVPRFGPLWAIPSPTGQAVTGMSDSLTLGDISALSESTELAFRVEFANERPTQQELYWRGVVLSEFDGHTWAASRRARTFFRQQHAMPVWWQHLSRLENPTYQYRIQLESTHNTWLFALAQSVSSDSDVGATQAGTLALQKPLYERFRYTVKSYPTELLPTSLSERERRRYLHLPPVLNPRTQALANTLRQEYFVDAEFVQGALRWFQGQPFTYTHQPPAVGEHANDDFLFTTQRGFCEHFASSFALLMRAGGVPARVVVGYQGGEWNPRSQHLSVYQYQAHAWVEVWLAERGWVLVDPTATFAPDRVEQERTVVEASSGGARHAWYGNQFVKALRTQLDWLEFSWQRWVLDYDEQQQGERLRNWLGEVTLSKLAWALLVLGSLLLLPTLLWALWMGRAPTVPPLQREFHWLRRHVARRGGVSLAISERWSANQLAEYGARCWPRAETDFVMWAQAMEMALYAGDDRQKNVALLRRLRRRFMQLPPLKQ